MNKYENEFFDLLADNLRHSDIVSRVNQNNYMQLFVDIRFIVHYKLISNKSEEMLTIAENKIKQILYSQL